MSEALSTAKIAPVPALKSLRAKGLIATLTLLGYLLAATVYVSLERVKIYDSMQSLQQLSRHEKALALAEAAVSDAVVDVSQISNAAQPEPAVPAEIDLYMESCDKVFAALEEFDPGYTLLQRAVKRSYASLREAPVRANWIDLRVALGRASDELEIRRRNLAEQRDSMTLSYQRQYDAVTVKSLLLSLLGIAVFGAGVAWFFARLTSDIRKLESHARQIVRGRRGVTLPAGREDELGRLMQAVNQMSVDLDEREKQIELDGQRRSHLDKMLTVGALAAGVAHEVNNPLAVIAGAAQALSGPDEGIARQRVVDAAQLILAQTQRASQAARNLAELAAPQSTELDSVDANATLQRVLQMLRYDKRYRHIEFQSAPAGDVPAMRAPAATAQQVLIQMMSLGCDAMAALPRGQARMRVATRRAGDSVDVEMEFPVSLDFALPDVQRVLLLSRALIEPQGGRLAI
ncbi:MAG: HAMP domain-containing protein, partial [Rhizobacter sp.]|nr:HAMP domain-containing protein [Rhizobacter sp.]